MVRSVQCVAILLAVTAASGCGRERYDLLDHPDVSTPGDTSSLDVTLIDSSTRDGPDTGDTLMDVVHDLSSPRDVAADHLPDVTRDVPIDVPPDVPSDPTVIYRGEDPTYLAIDLSASPRLFFTSPNAGTVRRIGTDGSSPTLVAGTQMRPTFVAADANSVYWTNDTSNEVMTSPLASSTPSHLFAVNHPTGLLADGTYVFFASESDGTISRYVLGGANAVYITLPAGNRAGTIGMGQANIYYADASAATITRRAKNGPAITALATSVQPTAMTANNSIVYFTSQTTNDFNRVALATPGTITVISPSPMQAGSSGVAYDSTWVYWTDNTSGQINRVDQATATNIQLVATAVHPWGIVVDATQLYWCDQGTGGNDGSVHRMAIPP